MVLSKIKNQYIFSLFLIAYTVVLYWYALFPFFWDTILYGSKLPHYYLEQNFQTLLPPDNLDTGHIPLIHIYWAFCWQIFGKSLWVSHWSMFPFVAGVVFFTYKILQTFIENTRYLALSMLFILTETTWCAQSILVSPDVVLVCFFLWAVYQIITSKNAVIPITMLCLVSFRGFISSVSLSVYLFFLLVFVQKRTVLFFFKKLTQWMLGWSIQAAYLLFHYSKKGWFIHAPNSQWEQARTPVQNIEQFVKGIKWIVWFIADYGRVGVVIFCIGMFFYFLYKKQKIVFENSFFILACVQFIFCGGIYVLYPAQIEHRILLPLFFSMYFFVLNILFNTHFFTQKLRLILYSIILLIQWSGSFWIYPAKYSMGWDSTLAHIPYYTLRYRMMQYIIQEKIPFYSIGSAFPNLAGTKYTDLFQTDVSFKSKVVGIDNFVLESNIFNDFTENELEILHTQYTVKKKLESGGVYLTLYQKH